MMENAFVENAFVFVQDGELHRAFAHRMAWLGLAALAVAALVWVATPRRAGPMGGRALGRGATLGFVAWLWALSALQAGYAIYRSFTSLRVDSAGLLLRYAGPQPGAERLALGKVQAVVAGDEGARQRMARGCHVRLWLVGGGSRVSATAAELPRERCAALRDQLDALLRTARGGA